MKKILTTRDVAVELSVSEKTVYRLVARGLLKRVGGLRVIRITRASLDAYLGEEVAQ